MNDDKLRILLEIVETFQDIKNSNSLSGIMKLSQKIDYNFPNGLKELKKELRPEDYNYIEEEIRSITKLASGLFRYAENTANKYYRIADTSKRMRVIYAIAHSMEKRNAINYKNTKNGQ